MKKKREGNFLLKKSCRKTLKILKLTMFFMIFGLVQAFANTNSQDVSLKSENTDLKEVIFKFQKHTITGKVTDSNGEPLPGASIIVKGTTMGTITDVDGNFALKVPEDAQTLVVSFIGYVTQEVDINGKSFVNIVMQEDQQTLNEVVVTALGIKRQKREVGYAVQDIKAADITVAAPVDISQGLQGKIAGLKISTANGGSNASSRVIIRGNNSLFGNNQPLIVIDGAIVDNSQLEQSSAGTSGSESSYQDWGNYLSYMDMSSVQDVTVLKGPSAAALYGARGANGVILITSKKGMDKPGIGLEYSVTTNFTDPYRFQDVQNEYGGGFRSALFTAHPELPKTADGVSWPAILYPYNWSGNPYPDFTGVESYHGAIPGGYNTWDVFSWFSASSSWGPKLNGQQALWYDGKMRPYSPHPDNREYMYKTALETTHNLSFSTANDFGSIRLGINSRKGDAVVENTDYDYTSFSLGSHVKISKMFSADINANYNINNRKNTPAIGNNNSWSKFNIYGMSREYIGLEKNLYKDKDLYDGYKHNFGGAYSYAEYSRDLFWNTYENNQYLYRDEFLSTIKLNAEFTPWLSAFLRTSSDLLGTRFETINNTSKEDGINGGKFEKTLSKGKIFNTDFMATVHKEDFFLDGFNTSLSLGYNDYYINKRGVQGRNFGTFKVPNIYSLSNYTDKLKTEAKETRYEVKSYSYIGLLNLSYNNYLFCEITGRQDANSTLPKENNTTFYPAVNASFVFTEAFDLGDVKNWLSYGNIRGTWGKSANATDPYQLDNAYDTDAFGGQTTITRPETVPPQNLTFQTSKTKEIGLGLGFLNNRINFDFTYYDILSNKQIMTSAISLASGAAKARFNSGELSNKGYEVTLNANVIKKYDFSWDLTLNAAKNTNKVVALAEGIDEQILGSVFGSLGAFIKASPGEEYGTIYGTDFELDDKGRKQVMNVYDKDGSGKVIGTQYKITKEVQKIGNAAPKLTGGLSNVFRYKNFRLYALVDFKYGGDIYSVDHATAMGAGLSPQTLKERNGGGLPYTFPDGTTDNVGMIMEGYNIDDERENDRVIAPAFYYGVTYAGWSHLNRARSLSVFENSWVKMREISLTYRLPNNLIKKTKVFQNMSISLIGRNLFYLYTTLPDHLNPEAINGVGNGQGLQWSQFPAMRTFGFNIKVGF